MGTRRALVPVPGPRSAYMGEKCKMSLGSLVIEIGFHITQAGLKLSMVLILWSPSEC